MTGSCARVGSREHDAFVGRNHVLEIDEGIFTSVSLEQLECFVDQLTKVGSLALIVDDLVSGVYCEDYELREECAVVLTYHPYS